ncbi:hypothetical protein L3X38_017500 [Prunus dulcis]|uniref:Reverse transcriptase domain-containing protein n=1 Tax=Prunus dulcis TaxID=3755 RepID=A0AAD4ZA76_PRUDU|nr:hypothetical protein L3X38_017500 [Prunus dulcis]
MEKIRVKLGFRQSIVEDSHGASGGLCLMWTEEVTARSFGTNHMTLRWRFLEYKIVGEDMVAAVLHFFKTGRLLKKINFTHVALIPKVHEPKNMMQLRPISLCNVLYKIGAKVLVTYLKAILPALISDTQSAFVPGHAISDNSIVAFELLHTMHKKNQGRQGYLALKIDMSKAYDRVEWSFLEPLMKGMGFSPQWIQLIMECVTTVSYCFMLNENPVGYVIPQRGLRQGQKIPLENSCVSFNNNMDRTDQDNLAAVLGVKRVDQHDVYLGLPTHVGRSRRQCFNSLKERIWKKIQGWKAKLSVRKIVNLDNHIALACAGLKADARVLINKAQLEQIMLAQIGGWAWFP